MDHGLQGSIAWLNYRRKRLGASDAPVILGKSPWSTPYKLWLQKTGRVEQDNSTNFAIQRGHRWEGAARARYELETGLELPPAVIVDKRYPFIMASLDGFSEAAGVVLEIKIPGADVFETAKKGKVHEKYYAQVQQQLYVTKAKEAHFYCCKVEKRNGVEDIVDTALVIVEPDEAYIKELLIQLIGFKEMIDKDIPPPLSPRDTVELEDQSSVILFAKMKKIKESMKSAEAVVKSAIETLGRIETEFDELKEELIDHVETLGHTKFHCLGVNCYKNKKGTWIISLDREQGDSDEAQILKQA